MIIKGKVKIIKKQSDYYDIKDRVILVAFNTTPDIVIVIHNIQAIITEANNKLCHAAIIAREYGIPLIMGVENATKKFKDGQVIKLDTLKKEIYD